MVSQHRRQEMLGIHSLDHFSFAVPDIGVAKDFYTSFGLDVRDAGVGGLELYTFGHPHRWARVGESKKKTLDYISFGAFADDIDRFRQRLQDEGVEIAAPPASAPPGGLWFKDPHGVLLNIRDAEKTSLDEKAPHGASPSPGLRGAPMRGEAKPVRPRRMSHALFFTPDIESSMEFYCRILGLRVSDHPGPVAFLHGVHGSDHHLIAFAQSHGTGYHHSAWDVVSVEEVGQGADQMIAAGHTKGWGLGRHVLGSNYFYYVRDPWGSFAEYSFDIDYVPLGLDWETGRPAPENSLFLWGPEPPDYFIVNYETV